MNRFLFILCFCVNLLYAQQTHYVDFKKVKTVLTFNQMKVDSTIFNSYEIKFDILKNTDSIYLDAFDMKFMNVALNQESVTFKNEGKKLIIYNKFKNSRTYTLNFLFFASPKKAMYFIDWAGSSTSSGQVWTQGQGKYTSHWLPSIDDMNDKIEFDISCVAPKGYQVISNGKMVSKRETPTSNLWEFDMEKPMSSYLVALVIGKYDKKTEYSKSGIPLEMYYYPEDSLKFEPTYRYSKQMFDFLEEEIGVSYPWQNYKQVPVKDFLYAGMENTSTTIFADSFVIDSIAFVDKNYVNVNAHELAHQWFGDLVTETSGTHHWLQEGFATYYALLAERDVFGDDYYYWRLYEYAQELLDQDKAGGSTSLLDPKSSSTTFYKKGAWVLHVLREKVGDEAFKKGVKNYLEKYQFKNVETDDFINEVEKASGEDLREFVKVWLVSEKLLYEEMEGALYLSSIFLKQYIQIDCSLDILNCEKDLSNGISDKAKIKIINQNISLIKKTHFNNSLKVRQAIAQNLSEIPLELKREYEALLNDKSYITIETALFNLWQNFPQEREKYLDKTKDIQGFSNKNVRILWLTLALLTEDYQPENKNTYFEELTDYTSPEYGFEIRQNAFQYLNEIKACNDVCNENLKQATKHHNWRFSKFAKSLLE
ncbi:MAG: M1 family metallopeptidase [Algibacter sp.]